MTEEAEEVINDDSATMTSFEEICTVPEAVSTPIIETTKNDERDLQV